MRRTTLGNPILKKHAEEEAPALTSVETCNESSTLAKGGVIRGVDEKRSRGRIQIVMH